jgi:hypothetical protein
VLSGLYILEESVGEALVRNVDRADLNIDRRDHAILRGTRQYSAVLCHRWYMLLLTDCRQSISGTIAWELKGMVL